jgi:uncharacterized protein (DUF1015 family)
VDPESIHHQLWRVTDPSTLLKIRESFRDKTVYIADGHHRYETSLAYQADMQRKHSELDRTAAFNFTLMFLCPMEDPGLTIFPVHRALNLISEINLLAEKELIRFYGRKSLVPEKKTGYPRNSFPARESRPPITPWCCPSTSYFS